MKRPFLSLFITLLTVPALLFAGEPFRGTFVEQELGMKMVIDLYKESVEVPEMEMFGPLNGYILGRGLYRTWYVSKLIECTDEKAVIHLSNDLGSETQTVELTLQGDSLMQFQQVDGSVMKKAVNRKLVKIPTKWLMKRIAD
ncbi:MAG: hypothetical protein K6A32_03700 [Bacteroidales bacterium]|nr:hypothetical protein [Bacteroidales bacterium]